MDNLISFKNQVIVSCQAMPEEPLYKEECMKAMMQSVVNGGAKILRVAGSRDVKMAKNLGVKVIGLTKPNKLPDNWKDVVYITPTTEDVKSLINAGADVIAFDGTKRPRPQNCKLEEIISLIHNENRHAMADISTIEEGIFCDELGADIISTTLAGYTTHSGEATNGPDFELLKELVKHIKKPIVLEGRIWEPNDIRKAFEYGAYCVVIGSAITRPQLITKRFINYRNV